MEQIIYGDVLFIVNFSMDFLTLYITGKIFHARIGVFSLTLAASLGALYGVLSLFQNGNGFLNIFINICISALMCYIAFGASSLICIVRNTAVMYSIGFLMGGTMTALFTIANRGLAGRSIIINGEAQTLASDIPFFAFILVAALSIIFSYICGLIIKRKSNTDHAKIRIELGGKALELEGLADSGNLLCEPAGGLPVVVCSYSSLEEILPIGVRKLYRDASVGILEYTSTEFAKKVRIIPVSHIGGNGLLIGFIPDKAEINGTEKSLCIACCSKNESFGEKECIIPSTLI